MKFILNGERCYIIKDTENLFYAESRLPIGFLKGLALILFYIAAVLAISYWRFGKSLQVG